MKKHLALAQMGLIALSPSLLANTYKEAKKTDKRPNILFIMSDDHTSQAWSIYGGILADYAKTENIQRLAREGCTLDNLFCTNSISVPSRASIMTGAYSHVNGVKTLEDAINPEADNIAKQVQQAGYQTAIIGKWHLKKEPTGFDYYSVFHDQGDYIDPVFKQKENWIDDTEGKHGDVVKGFSTDIVTEKTIEWIKNRNDKKPFMMMCHFKATHEPWDFPERMKHIYDGVTFPEPENMMEFDGYKSKRTYNGEQLEDMARRWLIATKDPNSWWCKYPELPFSVEGLNPMEARKKIYQKMVKDYLRCGATIDDNIGKLLDMLKKEGLEENTIVVYVSDQGYFLGEHGFMDKRMMLEESLRMPFVIRYPKEIPAGTRNNDILLNIDIPSLIADYTEANTPDTEQGNSFRENLKGNTPTDWRKDMYYRYWTHHNPRPAHMGIRTERYKLMFMYGYEKGQIEMTTPAWELYDLEKDPKENHNVYGKAEYKDVIKVLKARMLELRKEYKDTDLDDAHMQEILEKYY